MHSNLSLFIVLICASLQVKAQNQIPVTVENHSVGAPITMGLPFPKGELNSPDKVRVLDASGKEIASQITEVTTWEPLDLSIKWIWVFFFTNDSKSYTIEYGDKVVRKPYDGPTVTTANNQRSNGFVEITTGKIKIIINKGEGGFLHKVYFDLEGDGYNEDDLIALNDDDRGSFLDILDDLGIDESKAIIHRMIKEKGSGPLHSILRLEGEYLYSREDNNNSPFITRIHSYAGKSYLKILHTIVYTGVPDKHKNYDGQHANIATQNKKVISTYDATDSSWMQPNDQMAAVGFNLKYNLQKNEMCKTGYVSGKWWEDGSSQVADLKSDPKEIISVRQSGPNINAQPPLTVSSTTKRIESYNAAIHVKGQTEIKTEKGEGWIDISDTQRGITIGIRNYLEEFPKGYDIDLDKDLLSTYLWPPDEKPMSFARQSLKPDGQMLDNFAQGLAKTTELTYNFHEAGNFEKVRSEIDYFLTPSVAHADTKWYANSLVYGAFSSSDSSFPEYERGLDYKFDWVLFNQKWEPWYGMFDYGDFKTYYYNEDWFQWSNNEPSQDFMLWMQFMRTGNPKYYLAAEATSRHTMDVDNIHWPTFPKYDAGSNDAVDYWDYKDKSTGTPYLGIGRRHARQQWTALLSAHVWAPGWLASYYLTGYHRGLEIAKQTGDTYIRRIWGEHGLTGRRLYLSVWNLTELYDATKMGKYKAELDDRVERMLKLQAGSDQYNSLVMDRYGYTQVYASQSLSKYYQITGDERIKSSLIKHARAVRDIPPWNHKYESYLSSIHSLLIGYEYSSDPSFLNEAIKRAEVLKTDKLPKPFNSYSTQKLLAEALDNVSHLPEDPENRDVRGDANWSIKQGLRVFGWTHAYNVPYLLHWLRKDAKSLGK